MLWLGCPSAFSGLEFIIRSLEPQLKIINEPPRLVQTGLGVKAQLVRVFSVLREGTDACGHPGWDTEPVSRCLQPLSSGRKIFADCVSFALLCLPAACSSQPFIRLQYF